MNEAPTAMYWDGAVHLLWPEGSAWSINDSGQIVGGAGTHAMLWQNGKSTDLGLWTPLGIESG